MQKAHRFYTQKKVHAYGKIWRNLEEHIDNYGNFTLTDFLMYYTNFYKILSLRRIVCAQEGWCVIVLSTFVNVYISLRNSPFAR